MLQHCSRQNACRGIRWHSAPSVAAGRADDGEPPRRLLRLPWLSRHPPEGGSITGFIYAEDRVTGVIGRFLDGPDGNKTGLAAIGPGGKGEQPAKGALPYLQLVGTLNVTGQPTAATGDAVQVYGSGFCAAPRCSSVTLRIGDRVVAKSVKVDGKGSFKAAVKVTETPGHYRVSATQKTEKGEELRDERTLVVPVLDRDEE
jgi:hypothetical protein